MSEFCTTLWALIDIFYENILNTRTNKAKVSQPNCENIIFLYPCELTRKVQGYADSCFLVNIAICDGAMQ